MFAIKGVGRTDSQTHRHRHTDTDTQPHRHKYTDTQTPRHTSTATQARRHTDAVTQTQTQACGNPDTWVANRASLNFRRGEEEDLEAIVLCLQMPGARVPRFCEKALWAAFGPEQLRALPETLEVGGEFRALGSRFI